MLCVLAGLALAAASVLRIPEGQVYALRRVGGHMRQIGPGTHFMFPLVERITRKIDLAGTTLRIDDLASAGESLRAIVFYQVLDAARAASLLDGLATVLREATHELVARDDFSAAGAARARWLKQALNERLRDRGVIVARVDLA